MKLLLTFIIGFLALHSGAEGTPLKKNLFDTAVTLFKDVMTKTQETMSNLGTHTEEFFAKAEEALKETVNELDKDINKKVGDLKAEWSELKKKFPTLSGVWSVLDQLKNNCFATSMNVMSELTKRVGEFRMRTEKTTKESLTDFMKDVTESLSKFKRIQDMPGSKTSKCVDEGSSKLHGLPGIYTAKFLNCVDEKAKVIKDKIIENMKAELKKIPSFVEKVVKESKECAAQLHESDKPGPPPEVPCLNALVKEAVLEKEKLVAGIFKSASLCDTEVDKLMVESEICSRHTSLDAQVDLGKYLAGVGTCMNS